MGKGGSDLRFGDLPGEADCHEDALGKAGAYTCVQCLLSIEVIHGSTQSNTYTEVAVTPGTRVGLGIPLLDVPVSPA